MLPLVNIHIYHTLNLYFVNAYRAVFHKWKYFIKKGLSP